MRRARVGIVLWTSLILVIVLWSISYAAVFDVRRGCILGWDPNTESDLAGYQVYVSRVAGVYDLPPVSIPAGRVTASCAELGLEQGLYYVRVTAIDTWVPTNESVVSNELQINVLVQVRVY